MTRSVEIPDAAMNAAFRSWNGMHVGTAHDRLRAALVAARPYLMPTADVIAKELQAHYPRTGMVVASGVTCECGYWNGSESPGKDRPVGAQGRDGLNWHRAQIMSALLNGEIKKGEDR